MSFLARYPSTQHSIPEYRAPTLPKPRALRYMLRPVSRKKSFVCCIVVGSGGIGRPFSWAASWAAARLLLRRGSSTVRLALKREKKPPRAKPAAPLMAHFVGHHSMAPDIVFVQYSICCICCLSSSVYPGGRGSCPGRYTGTVITCMGDLADMVGGGVLKKVGSAKSSCVHTCMATILSFHLCWALPVPRLLCVGGQS